MFEALSKISRTDVALKMLNVTEYPSFGFQITNTMEPVEINLLLTPRICSSTLLGVVRRADHAPVAR